jgi:[ribosomal protein S5]-alanine N-acetyltransferase
VLADSGPSCETRGEGRNPPRESCTAPAAYRFLVARIESERLIGRPAAVEDAPFFERLWADPRVMAHLGGMRSADETARALELSATDWEANGFGRWVVSDACGPVGTVKLAQTTVRDHHEIELGYAFLPAVWGRGYATEVGGVVIDFARKVLELDQLVAFALISNAPSVAVMKRLAFKPDGTFERPAGRHALFRKELRSDVCSP